jgi:hypothetical protein
MPNGGSDCCGTCWFNARNKGQADFRHADRSIPAYCTIRDLPIASPFYTYCSNHPYRRRERDPIPIGPAFTGDSTGTRTFWQPSPDTEEIRLHLLNLLAQIEEQPASEYPIGIYRDEMVVWQLGEFRETRAVEELQRIAHFDPEAHEAGPFGRTRRKLIATAKDALSKIDGAIVQHDDSADPPGVRP